MIVRLWTGKQIIVSKDQAKRIEGMILREYKLIDINGEKYKPSAIASIENGGTTEADRVPPSKRISVPEISNEQRAKNREKLKRMKQDFINRKQKNT